MTVRLYTQIKAIDEILGRIIRYILVLNERKYVISIMTYNRNSQRKKAGIKRQPTRSKKKKTTVYILS